MPEKFFLISQVFYPDEVSTSSLFTNLCTYISKSGVEVEVWSAQPTYTHSARQPRYLQYEGINIRYLSSTRFRKSSIPGRILNILSFMITASFKLLFSKDRSPVLTHTTFPALGIVLSIICNLKRRKFVYIMLDIYPEGLIRLGKLNAKNVLVRLWKRAYVNALKRSQKIIVLGRDMREYIEGIYADSKNKIEYIPHWQDDKLIHPIDTGNNHFFNELNLKRSFVVQYSGNMGLWNDMESIGRAVAVNQDDVCFVFIGDGIRKNELQDIIHQNDSRNVVFLPFQPRENLCEVLTACHVALVSLRTGLEGMAVPSKIYGILAAGIPVIALVPENSEIAYIVKEEECGIVVQPTDNEGINRAIMRLKSDDILLMKLGNNGRRAFESKYTTQVIAEKYMTLIKKLQNG